AALARLRELEDIEAACRAALRALARRSHARLDLSRKLVKKQHPPAAVEAALQRLAAQRLIDDRRFAEQYAGVRAARGRGPSRIVKDLLAQGVDRRTAEESVRRAFEEEGVDPEVEARAVAAKRARQLAELPARAGGRPHTAVHQRRDGAVQAGVPSARAARLRARGDLPEVRPGGRQAQRPGAGRPYRPSPHLLRDARQLLLR